MDSTEILEKNLKIALEFSEMPGEKRDRLLQLSRLYAEDAKYGWYKQ
ncbi:MAG: hypothetical protein NWF14_00785 [Candidatus Bathyarchaeota archaeon]|nr:hypothetical protein [Candidatus Bathyarchaeota archaeon]